MQQSSVLDDLNIEQWFVERRLNYKPKHFITTKTPLTKDSAIWIFVTLTGRFTFEGNKSYDDNFYESVYPSFENPAEAVMYELKWS